MSRRITIVFTAFLFIIILVLSVIYLARTPLVNVLAGKYAPEEYQIKVSDIEIGWKTMEIEGISFADGNFTVDIEKIEVLYWQTDYTVEHGIELFKLKNISLQGAGQDIEIGSIMIDKLEVFRTDIMFGQLLLENLLLKSDNNELQSVKVDKLTLHDFSLKGTGDTDDRSLSLGEGNLYTVSIGHSGKYGASQLTFGRLNLNKLNIENISKPLINTESLSTENIELSNNDISVQSSIASIMINKVVYDNSELMIETFDINEIYHEPSSGNKDYFLHFPSLQIKSIAYNDKLFSFKNLLMQGDSQLKLALNENGKANIIPEKPEHKNKITSNEQLKPETQPQGEQKPSAELVEKTSTTVYQGNDESVAKFTVNNENNNKPDADKTAATKDSPGKKDKKPEAHTNESNPGFLAEKVSLDGTLAITINDREIDPAVKHDLLFDKLDISMLDTRVNAPKAILDTHATIHSYSDIWIQSEFHPEREGDFTLKGKFTKIDLVTLSPYIVENTGYKVHSGEIDLKIDASATSHELEGKADILVRKLELETVNKELAASIGKQLSMPLPTALKILRDKNNNISLNIPVEGHMDDPDFGMGSIGKILTVKALKAVTKNYIKNAILPSSLLVDAASFFAGSIYDSLTAFPPIIFEPGSAELDEEALKIIDEVGEFVDKKDDVYLKVCPVLLKSELSDMDVQAPGELAENRQAAVRSALIEEGVDRAFLMNCHYKIEEKGKPLIYLPMK